LSEKKQRGLDLEEEEEGDNNKREQPSLQQRKPIGVVSFDSPVDSGPRMLGDFNSRQNSMASETSSNGGGGGGGHDDYDDSPTHWEEDDDNLSSLQDEPKEPVVLQLDSKGMINPRLQ
jgi:hypothetical protein